MGKTDNLILGGKAHTLTVEEQSAGGKRSGEVRAARKTLREELLALLAADVTDKKGRTAQANVAISNALLHKALKGDTKAFEIIRDTIGEKPVEKVMIAEVDQAVIDEVEAAVFGGATADEREADGEDADDDATTGD